MRRKSFALFLPSEVRKPAQRRIPGTPRNTGETRARRHTLSQKELESERARERERERGRERERERGREREREREIERERERELAS